MKFLEGQRKEQGERNQKNEKIAEKNVGKEMYKKLGNGMKEEAREWREIRNPER